jgi:hypothetical protein
LKSSITPPPGSYVALSPFYARVIPLVKETRIDTGRISHRRTEPVCRVISAFLIG